MFHSSNVSLGMPCLEQERIPLAVAAVAELECVREFEGGPVVIVEFAAGIVGVAL